jgi:hypothetical protein
MKRLSKTVGERIVPSNHGNNNKAANNEENYPLLAGDLYLHTKRYGCTFSLVATVYWLWKQTALHRPSNYHLDEGWQTQKSD